jgi:hypothetical protein
MVTELELTLVIFFLLMLRPLKIRTQKFSLTFLGMTYVFKIGFKL